MKTLIFTASPNKKGNTQTMLNSFLKGLNGEINIINSYDVKVNPCIDCKFCASHEGECSIKDDMTKIYKMIDESDNIVIFSPMYFASYPGTLKNIIDRTQVYWSKKYILKKREKITRKGFLFIDAGSEWNDMFKPMENMFRYFMKSLNGTIFDKMYIPSTDNNPIKENHKVMQELCYIAKNIK